MLKITVKTVPSQIVYAILANEDHLLWDNINGAFVNPCSVDWDNFAIQCIEDEGITSGTTCLRPMGSYNGSIQSLDAGVFTLSAYVQVGASPDDEADTLISSTPVFYDGNEEINTKTIWDLLQLLQSAVAAFSTTSSGGLTKSQESMLRVILNAVTNRDNNSVNNYSA